MNALPKALVLKLTRVVKSGSETMVPQEMASPLAINTMGAGVHP